MRLQLWPDGDGAFPDGEEVDGGALAPKSDTSVKPVTN